MGRNVKVLIGLLAVVVLAIVGFKVTGSALVAGGIVVVGILAGVVILRRIAEGEGRLTRKSNDLVTHPRPSASPSPTAEPLATWSPPASSTDTPTLEEDLPADSTWDDGQWHDGAWDDSAWEDTAVALDENPLDELDRLDDVDVIAEVERLEHRDSDVEPLDEIDDLAPTDTLTADDTTVVAVDFEHREVNEAVSTPDDILEASRVTELVGEPDNSELARLLAKVQARLATYE